jgi:hypothetical protein
LALAALFASNLSYFSLTFFSSSSFLRRACRSSSSFFNFNWYYSCTFFFKVSASVVTEGAAFQIPPRPQP